MSTDLWIVETVGNLFLFIYLGLLLWLYYRKEDDT